MRTRAIRIETFGPPGALREREVPLPDPASDEVHVSVDASGVNFADLLMRAGLYGTHPPLPFVPGFEVAGRVARVGHAVRGLREGDRVVAMSRHGGYARDVVVPASRVFPIPAGIGAVEAASIPVVFLTAWTCIVPVGAARPGTRALVLGAGGGVGTAAVQLAVDLGLEVLGTAGTEAKRRFVVESLGARACFDSRGDWEAEIRKEFGDRPIDLALDSVGGGATASCRRLLAPLGRLVFYGLSAAMPGDRRARWRAALAWLATPRFHPLSLVEPGIGIHGVHLLHLDAKLDRLHEGWTEVIGAVSAKRVRPVVDRTFPLTRDGAVAAHERLHARANLGKIVLAREEST